tara:strand:+ start:204 stop:695 length:492 start_codon:yes stop_codon:yes gene_type:complete
MITSGISDKISVPPVRGIRAQPTDNDIADRVDDLIQATHAEFVLTLHIYAGHLGRRYETVKRTVSRVLRDRTFQEVLEEEMAKYDVPQNIREKLGLFVENFMAIMRSWDEDRYVGFGESGGTGEYTAQNVLAKREIRDRRIKIFRERHDDVYHRLMEAQLSSN